MRMKFQISRLLNQKKNHSIYYENTFKMLRENPERVPFDISKTSDSILMTIIIGTDITVMRIKCKTTVCGTLKIL